MNLVSTTSQKDKNQSVSSDQEKMRNLWKENDDYRDQTIVNTLQRVIDRKKKQG